MNGIVAATLKKKCVPECTNREMEIHNKLLPGDNGGMRTSSSPQKNTGPHESSVEAAGADGREHELISAVSHELRTPLTSIRGALALVISGAAGILPDKARELLAIALRNSERLVQIVNDILDAEKIESGHMRMQVQPVALTPFLEQALAYNEPYAEKFNVRFKLQSVCSGAAVMADPDRLMQIVTNLLSNAAKFSPPQSEILLRAQLEGGKAVIEVEDRGAGIPLEFQSQIFEKFAQAPNSGAQKREGTGLGLNLSRQLVELMQGEIDFRTEIGKGTVFYLRLPIASQPHSEVM